MKQAAMKTMIFLMSLGVVTMAYADPRPVERAANSATQLKATEEKGKAEKDEANVQNSQAAATAMQSGIQQANTQMNQALNNVNSDIQSAGNTLSQMSDVSSETLQKNKGSA